MDLGEVTRGSVKLRSEQQGCPNCKSQVAVAIKFCMVAPYICGPQYGIVFRILAYRILRWHLEFWKICEPLLIIMEAVASSTTLI